MAKQSTRAASAERGEFSINLDGQDMVLRPSHEAIDEFEAETGKGLIELTRAAATMTLKTTEVAAIVGACIRAWGRANNTSLRGVNNDRVRELVAEADGGIVSVTTTLSAVLSLAATGGLTAQGEMKATTTNPKTTA